MRDVRAHCVCCVAARAGPLGAWRCLHDLNQDLAGAFGPNLELDHGHWHAICPAVCGFRGLLTVASVLRVPVGPSQARRPCFLSLLQSRLRLEVVELQSFKLELERLGI